MATTVWLNVIRLQTPLLSLAIDYRGKDIMSRESHHYDRGLTSRRSN